MPLTIKQILNSLYRSSWIQIMDLAAVYSLPLDSRIKKGWAALCRTSENNPAELVYKPLAGEICLYERDLASASLVDVSENLKITLIPPKWPKYKLSEKYNPRNREHVIFDNNGARFENGKTYQLNESYTSFDATIAGDIAANTDEYEQSLRMLLDLGKSAQKCKKISREYSREELLRNFSDTDIPVMFLQGPPGTGKTTFIADLVEHMVKSGIKPGDICCIAKTRRAVAEIYQKLSDKIRQSKVLDADMLAESPSAAIKDCDGMLYVGTIHKNGPKARFYSRPVVLIDESSQIAIPTLLYGLRYRSSDGIIRFFGDQRQLAPTSSYIRDYTLIPEMNWDTFQQKFLSLNPDGQVFLSAIENALKNEMVFGDKPPREQMISLPFIRKITESQINSACSQSIFSLPEFIGSHSGTVACPELLIEQHRSATFALKKGYRQEQTIHSKTNSVFYPDITEPETSFPLAEANAEEAARIHHSNIDEQERDRLLGHITSDIIWIKNKMKRIFGAVKKFFLSLIFRRTIADDLKISDKEKGRLRIYVPPFQGREDSEILRLAEEIADNAGQKELLKKCDLNVNPSEFIKLLLPALRKQIVIISHSYPSRDTAGSSNALEIWFSTLMLRLWESEMLRVANGLGVVTPFRNQESRIVRHYIACFPESNLAQRRDWCATPERFQGRDLSRVICSLVTSSDEMFLGPTTMFSSNKLNVATSRAGSQQIIIGHGMLFSREAFDEYVIKARQLDEPARTIVADNAMNYRKKLIEYAEHAEKDPECAIVTV